MNPFYENIDERLRGEYVRVINDDGKEYRGWVERVHHQEHHVMLRDATVSPNGETEQAGSVLISSAIEIATLDVKTDIRRISLSEMSPSVYHQREFKKSQNRDYIEQVNESGYAGSYPTVKEIDTGYEIVEGHKRLWIAGQANLDSHPVEVVDISDWEATRRFVNDHYPTEKQINNGTVADGYYGDNTLVNSMQTVIDEWGKAAFDLDRVWFNMKRLGINSDGVEP